MCYQPPGTDICITFSLYFCGDASALLGIHVRMIPSVLTQVVENLGVLGDGASPLGKHQELVQLPLHESFRDMVHRNAALNSFQVTT